MADVVLVVVWACAVGGAILNLALVGRAEVVHLGRLPLDRLDRDRGAAPALGADRPGGGRHDRLRRRCSTAPARSSTRPSDRTRSPEVFGYHEIFHLFVIVAAAVQYAAIAIYALPEG